MLLINTKDGGGFPSSDGTIFKLFLEVFLCVQSVVFRLKGGAMVSTKFHHRGIVKSTGQIVMS